MKLNSLVGNIVESTDSRRAGIIVVKFPSQNRAIFSQSAADINNPRGTKIGPGEFFFPRPHQLNRPLGRARQSRRLDRGFARVFSSIS